MSARITIEPNSIIWHFKNHRSDTIYLSLFSQDRDVAWPGDGRVYTLSYQEECTIVTRGYHKEKVCYGAWTQNGRRYWGVGQDNQERCHDCCYECVGVETREIGFI